MLQKISELVMCQMSGELEFVSDFVSLPACACMLAVLSGNVCMCMLCYLYLFWNVVTVDSCKLLLKLLWWLKLSSAGI